MEDDIRPRIERMIGFPIFAADSLFHLIDLSRSTPCFFYSSVRKVVSLFFSAVLVLKLKAGNKTIIS